MIWIVMLDNPGYFLGFLLIIVIVLFVNIVGEELWDKFGGDPPRWPSEKHEAYERAGCPQDIKAWEKQWEAGIRDGKSTL